MVASWASGSTRGMFERVYRGQFEDRSRWGFMRNGAGKVATFFLCLGYAEPVG